MTTENDVKLDEVEVLSLALAQERVTSAQLHFQARQRELESAIAAVREKYQEPGFQLTGLDLARGVITRKATDT